MYSLLYLKKKKLIVRVLSWNSRYGMSNRIENRTTLYIQTIGFATDVTPAPAHNTCVHPPVCSVSFSARVGSLACVRDTPHDRSLHLTCRLNQCKQREDSVLCADDDVDDNNNNSGGIGRSKSTKRSANDCV